MNEWKNETCEYIKDRLKEQANGECDKWRCEKAVTCHQLAQDQL